jgi:hypothetical protein
VHVQALPRRRGPENPLPPPPPHDSVAAAHERRRPGRRPANHASPGSASNDGGLRTPVYELP